jgi:hypothetical protein
MYLSGIVLIGQQDGFSAVGESEARYYSAMVA